MISVSNLEVDITGHLANAEGLRYITARFSFQGHTPLEPSSRKQVTVIFTLDGGGVYQYVYPR